MSCVASATLTSFQWQEGGARPSLYYYCTVIASYCATRILFLGHSVFGFQLVSFGGYILRLVTHLSSSLQLPMFQLPRLQLSWLDWGTISVTMAKWAAFRSVEHQTTDSYINNFIMPPLGELFLDWQLVKQMQGLNSQGRSGQHCVIVTLHLGICTGLAQSKACFSS